MLRLWAAQPPAPHPGLVAKAHRRTARKAIFYLPKHNPTAVEEDLVIEIFLF
jgi:hypothetical protein